MNPDALSRQAIRLAMRTSRKAGRQLTREEVLKLRVQTFGVWKRALVIFIGLCAVALSVLCYRNGAPLLATGAFGICSLFLIGCGAIGRRTYLETELKKLTFTRTADAIVTGIVDGLT